MNSEDYKNTLLVSWREESELTQQAVAKSLDVDRNTIYRAEAGKAASFKLLKRLCTLYGKPIVELLNTEVTA